MERFAIKIDTTVQMDLMNLCRLCGMDNPVKLPIICGRQVIEDPDEPTLCKKIFACVGVQVGHLAPSNCGPTEQLQISTLHLIPNYLRPYFIFIHSFHYYAHQPY